jgi:hypothetical protein
VDRTVGEKDLRFAIGILGLIALAAIIIEIVS